MARFEAASTRGLSRYPAAQTFIRRQPGKVMMLAGGVLAILLLLALIATRKHDGPARKHDVHVTIPRLDAGPVTTDLAPVPAPTKHATVETPVDAAVAPAVAAVTACPVEVTSVPDGAEIVIDKTTVLGTTPATISLPCGVEAKLVLRKPPRFMNEQRVVTPTPESAPIKVVLAVWGQFAINVSSVPSGARVLLGAKWLGLTPTTIKLPAFETVTLTVTKDGFAPVAHRLTPKQNNQGVTITLKKP